MRTLFVGSAGQSVKAKVDQVRHEMPTLETTVLAEVSDALLGAESFSPDAVILELARPHASARETIQQFVSVFDAPLFVIGHEGDGLGLVKALELGADDYVLVRRDRELVARIVAFLRRLERIGSHDALIESGPLSINPHTRGVFLNGVKLELTVEEYRLLLLLIRFDGQPLSDHFLQEILWGGQKAVGQLKRTALRLNRKRRGESSSRRWIVSDGAEFRFVGPVRAALD